MPDMASGRELSIGHLARRTGVKVETIRYYEQVGLMPEPLRTAGNQRRYGPAHTARLGFIRHGRELGFTLEQVREMLELSDRPDRPCEEIDQIARDHLAAVERRIGRLEALRQELQRMIRDCDGQSVCECRIVEVLSDHTHAHCLDPAHGRECGEESR